MLRLCLKIAFLVCIAQCVFVLGPGKTGAQAAAPLWTFAVSGDSRNCGDFVMPAIAAGVKAEGDAVYWHLGDFRWMSKPDEDPISMNSAPRKLSMDEYHRIAWDDFLKHQM